MLKLMVLVLAAVAAVLLGGRGAAAQSSSTEGSASSSSSSFDGSLWEMNLGSTTQYDAFLLAKDGLVVYTIWSVNAWAPRPVIFLLAINTSNGHMIWNASLFGMEQTNQQYVFSEGSKSVYVTSVYQGQVAAIDKSTGGLRWLITPFASLGNGLTCYGAVEGPESNFVYIDSSRNGVLLNASTGVQIPEYQTLPFAGNVPILWQNASGFTYAYFPGSYQNVYVTLPNRSAAIAWTMQPEKGQYPSLLVADPTMAIVNLAIGPGVPRIIAVDSSTGTVKWNVSTFNSDKTYSWAALTEQVVVTLLGSVLIGIDRATGAVLWEKGTGGGYFPMLFANGTRVAVYSSAKNQASKLTVFSYCTSTGALEQTWVIANKFGYSQQAQVSISAAAGVIISTISTTTQSNVKILRAVPLTPAPPAGVLVKRFTGSTDCTGVYEAEISPTGCTPADDGGFILRSCTAAALTIALYSPSSSLCSGSPESSQQWQIQSCYASPDGTSFVVDSCSVSS